MSASRPPLGFAIYGLGIVADFHAQAIAHLQGARLVAVASRNAAKTQAFAVKHAVPFATVSLTELVARPEVDVVCITTSSGAHLEPALAAIKAGKHVIIEKPIEITTERIDQILHAARAAQVQVVPIFQGRFGEGAKTVKAAIAAGRLGKLVLASAYVKWHRAAAYYTGTRGTWDIDGGGVIMAQAIHGLDLLQWFAGMPEEVFSWSTRRLYDHIQAEDTAAAALKFPGGALGAIEASTALWPGWQRRLEICGTTGSIALEDDKITRWEFKDPQPGDDEIRAAKDKAAMGTGASAPNSIGFVGHQRQMQDLVDALRDGRPPSLDGDEGRKAVALVRALYASAKSGQSVRIA